MYNVHLRGAICLVALVLFSVSISSSARAEGVGKILGLFGEVIKNDINRKQQQKQQQRYEQQLRAERQRELDAQREYQISQVKRTQVALKRLGFYKKRIDGDAGPGTQRAINSYIRAFNLTGFQIADYDIGQLERHAASGFSSNKEASEARSGGFDNAEDLRLAKQEGFSTASEWRQAELAGFKNKRKYDAFLASGFSNRVDFESATRVGFSNIKEMAKAQDAGFNDQASYASFLKSGHSNKASYEAALRETARLASNKAQCEADIGLEDWTSAIVSCQVAMSNAPQNDEIRKLNDQALNGSLKLTMKLEEKKSVIEATIKALESPVNNQETDAQRTIRELKIAKFRNELKANNIKLGTILGMKKGGECRAASASEDWTSAKLICAEANKLAPSPQWAELYDKATEMVAAEDARVAKLAAKEASRLALDEAKSDGTRLLNEIELFSGEGGSFANGLNVAQALIGLRSVMDGESAAAIELKAADLSALLEKETDFQSYLKKQKNAVAVATANAAASAKEEAQRNADFLLDFIGKNVTFGQVSDLLSMRGVLDEALASGSLERITLANNDTNALLDRLSLTDERKVHFAKKPAKSVAELDAENLFKAENGLAITDGNRALLEGAPDDVIVLYSKLPSAPHVAVNLLGNVTFVDGVANTCWAHEVSLDELRMRYLGTELGKLGIRTERLLGQCSVPLNNDTDVIILQRKQFLAEPVDKAQKLINRFVGGDFAILYQLNADAFENVISGSAESAELILTEIKADARSGHGLIALPNGSQVMCGVVDSDGEAHQLVLSSISEKLLYLLNGEQSFKPTNLEAAFLDLQKARCGTLYTSAPNMKLVLNALERQSLDHSVLPIWITDQQLASAIDTLKDTANAEVALAAQKKKQFLLDQAEKKQREEGRAQLAAQIATETAAENVRKQALLRQQNEKASSLAFRELEKIIATHISAEPVGSDKRSSIEQTMTKFAGLFPSAASWFVSDAQAEEEARRILERANFSELFPQASRWVRNSKNQKWELDAVEISMVDFGQAVWKKRLLDTVFANTTVQIKNRLLGEYRTFCFQSGMMIDNEFSYIRAPVEGQCNDANAAIQSWKVGNKFTSLWVVN